MNFIKEVIYCFYLKVTMEENWEEKQCTNESESSLDETVCNPEGTGKLEEIDAQSNGAKAGDEEYAKEEYAKEECAKEECAKEECAKEEWQDEFTGKIQHERGKESVDQAGNEEEMREVKIDPFEGLTEEEKDELRREQEREDKLRRVSYT